MCQHAAPGEGVQHLRGVRAHPGSGPGRQDEDRRFALRSQENLLGFWPLTTVSVHVHTPPLVFSVSLSARSRQRWCTAPERSSMLHMNSVRRWTPPWTIIKRWTVAEPDRP